MGMVGGGPGSFIGPVHYKAAVMDGQIKLVCGAFSSDPEKSKITGKEYYLQEDRIYGSWEEMILSEKRLSESVRMDLLSITTPNHLHFGPAKMALENGFHVVCDKPLAVTVDEARELVRLTVTTGLVFALTHTYAGYPMVKEARHLVRSGGLGQIRKVVSEYPQGWLTEPLERTGHVQASWRGDPERTGKTSCVGDIGTHAFHLAEYITGLKVTELYADLGTLVPGRKMDDDASMLLHFNNGARGVLYASQVSAGEENGMKIRIYGEKGGLEWTQTEPNSLIVKWHNKPTEIRRAGTAYLCKAARYNTRLPAGHPEGYIEAFANIYRNVATTLQYSMNREEPPEEALDFPDVHDGLRGMQFIEAVVDSNRSKTWVSL